MAWILGGGREDILNLIKRKTSLIDSLITSLVTTADFVSTPYWFDSAIMDAFDLTLDWTVSPLMDFVMKFRGKNSQRVIEYWLHVDSYGMEIPIRGVIEKYIFSVNFLMVDVI